MCTDRASWIERKREMDWKIDPQKWRKNRTNTAQMSEEFVTVASGRDMKKIAAASTKARCLQMSSNMLTRSTVYALLTRNAIYSR